MNYIDYRERLGISFDKDDAFELMKTKCMNYLNKYIYENYSENDYYNFCSTAGYDYDHEEFDFTFENIYYCLNRENHSKFLFSYIIFLNTLSDDKKREFFTNSLLISLNESNIQYEVIEEYGVGIFVIPKGAKELDDALVSQPLEWLKDYPKSHATFIRALKQYSNGDYARDVADNFRKALEEFLQEFLGNGKNLETNKNEICRVLGENGADSNIGSMLQALLNSYKNLNDKVAKHNDKVDAKFLEFLMYQTGLFIRMIITTCDNKEEE